MNWIVQTIDFGDCWLELSRKWISGAGHLFGIVQTIDFGCCLLVEIVKKLISGAAY